MKPTRIVRCGFSRRASGALPRTRWYEDEVRDYVDMVKAAGYTAWTGVGKAYMVPLMLTVWARSEEPSFLFDLEGADETQTVYAASLPDALTLLNQLAPTLQALAVTDQIAQAEPETMSVLADVLDKLHGRRRGQNGAVIQK